MYYKNLILMGDTGTGKTRSLVTLTQNKIEKYRVLNNNISAVRYIITLNKGTRDEQQVRFTFWDSVSSIVDFKQDSFFPGAHMDYALIFINLNQHKAYSTLTGWRKKILNKKPGIECMVVGTVTSESQKENEQTRVNTVKALEWCQENDDSKYIEIDVTDYQDVSELYEDIARHLTTY